MLFTLLVVDGGVDDVVADRLGHYILGVLRAVQLQFLRDVSQRDPRVRQVDHTHARLDDVVPQPHYQCVCVVGSELLAVLTERLRELGQVA